jgi:hypothetical protein
VLSATKRCGKSRSRESFLKSSFPRRQVNNNIFCVCFSNPFTVHLYLFAATPNKSHNASL